MKPSYPLFIVAEDRSVTINNAESDLSWYEKPDIDEGIYYGWDVQGYPLKLICGDDGIVKAEITDDHPQLYDLKKAIVRYANTNLSPEDQGFRSDIDDDVVELYKAADAYIRSMQDGEPSLMQRLKGFLFGRRVQGR